MALHYGLPLADNPVRRGNPTCKALTQKLNLITHLQLKELKEEALQLALENERMKTELEVTRRIQIMILPQKEELEQVAGLAIAGFMEPAEEVGGDYYEVLQHDNNGRILISIGDVTGHGLESGMLMLMTQAAVRTLLENDEQDTVKFFSSLNSIIYKNAQERLEVDKNLTLSLLEYVPTYTGDYESVVVMKTSLWCEMVNWNV